MKLLLVAKTSLVSTKPQLRSGTAHKIFNCRTRRRDGVWSWLYNHGTSSFEGGITLRAFSWTVFEREYLYQLF